MNVGNNQVPVQPATARGVRTRAALVWAARTIFERDGFLASRLTDITAEAECSVGTFYTYFNTKDEIFDAVMESAKGDMLHPGMSDDAPRAGGDYRSRVPPATRGT